MREVEASYPSVVSLFSGAGGLDIGLEKAGFATVFANDFDPDCIETLKANRRREIPIDEGGDRFFLREATISQSRVEALSRADIVPPRQGRQWRPDILAGGPPCQPFSSSGKQLALRDPRGNLFEDFVRLADELRPRLILFENVRGIVTARGPRGRPGEVVARVRAAFEAIGYATTFSLLNAADFGTPQRRVRLFMMATDSAPLPKFRTPRTRSRRVMVAQRGKHLARRSLGFQGQRSPKSSGRLGRLPNS